MGKLIGSFAGFAIGGILGLMAGDDTACHSGWVCFHLTTVQKAILLGIPLALVGASIGRSIGAIKVTIPINGSFNNFNKHKTNLETIL